MKAIYRLIRRAGVFYTYETSTGKRESLRTRDRTEALQHLTAKTQAKQQPVLNLRMARVYLSGSDPQAITRTWRDVLNYLVASKRGENKARWQRMDRHRPFATLWGKVVIETTAEDFWSCLNAGSVTTNKFLRILRNFALDMGWLPHPLIPSRQWPAVSYGPKRAITREEHERIVAREKNEERKAYYRLAWVTGAAQTDLANLTADKINWEERCLSFFRKKTGTPVHLYFGGEAEEILKTLPQDGPLFPGLRTVRASDRATEFAQRCQGLGITGVTLHSYRYSWASRAQQAGYPERWAMLALGHQSKAVHRAYLKSSDIRLPALESYETKSTIVAFPTQSTDQISLPAAGLSRT